MKYHCWGYIWLSTINHAERVSNYNSFPFTFTKPDIKNLEEKKNLTLARVTTLSKKKGTVKIGMFSVFRKKKAKYTKYLKYISTYVK